jgi:ATP-binding cassette, subfamily B, bacterial IrtA/YbtP
MSALKDLRRPVAGWTRAGTVLSAIGALTTLVPFIGIAELARKLLNRQDVTATAVVIATGVVFGFLANGAALSLTHVADAKLQATLRRRIVRRLGQVPLGWYSTTTSGAVRKVAQDDIEELHHLVAHHDVELTGAVVLPLGGFAYLVWLDWRLALLAVATLPVYVVAYGFMMREFSEKMMELDAGLRKVSAAIIEFVHGIAVVKAFGQANRAHRGYLSAVREYGDRYAGWVRPILRLEAVTSMALAAPVVAVVSLAGGVALSIDPVDLLAEVLVAMTIPTTLLTLNNGFTAQRRAVAAAKRIAELLDAPVLPVPAEPQVPDGHLVEFDGVSFSYNGSTNVLDGVTLTCLPGTITALVGSSGAGKSTVAKLVPRFYDVTAGSVRVGGVDVRQIAPEVLYRVVGFLLQDVQLLHGTVAENIRLGWPSASDEEVVAAARAARIHDKIVSLPDGYDTVDPVFSGGEAQRVSIARALLADTPVLVLDEATAYADRESEAEIQDGLSLLAKGRTVLVIAHRLTTVAGAHQIAVMDGGRIAEIGTHEQLLAEDGRYARMWHASAEATL